MKEKVIAAKVESYAASEVERGIQEVLAELGGLDRFVSAGDTVLLKPNMLEGMPPEKGVTTHPEVLRAMIRAVKAVGATPVVGDSPGATSTVKAAEKCGIATVCQEEGADLVPFEGAVEIAHPAGLSLRKFSLAQPLTQVDKVISLAKMKTHTFMGLTGATKNLFGLIVGLQKAQFHLRMQARRDFAGMLIDLANLVQPVLSIVDGVEGMEGNGPRNGRLFHGGLLLAGTNCFAVDVVMAEVMGFQPQELPVTALALAQGLTPPLAEVAVCGSAATVRLQCAPPDSMKSLEDRLPKWAVAFGRRHLTARPLITDDCIGCGRCAAHCPPKAMELQQGKVHIDYSRCIRCYCCQELCPANAVMVYEGATLRLLKRLL